MANNLEDFFGRFQGFAGLGNLGAGGEQSPRNGRVIPFVAMPAMLRTVERPGERIAAVLAFKDVDGGVVGDKSRGPYRYCRARRQSGARCDLCP